MNLLFFLLTATPALTPNTAPAQEAVAEQTLRAAYQSGKYDAFLADMDKAYKKAKADNALEGLIDIRKTHAAPASDQFVQGYESIQQEKNAALLAAVKDQDGLFANKVRAAAMMPSSQELAAEKALSFMNTGAPGSGNSVDENALLDIGLEFAYKTIHLDSMALTNKISDLKQKRMVLEMARMDKMLAASKSFEHKALKAEVAILAEQQDVRLARVSALSDLKLLANGKVKPANALEEQVASVLANASQQIADLHRDVMNAELKAVETVQK